MHVDNPLHVELKVDGEMIPKGEDLSQVTDISYNFGEESDSVVGFWLPF